MCAAAALGAVLLAALPPDSGHAAGHVSPGALLFRQANPAAHYGMLGMTAALVPATRSFGPFACEVVHFAGGRGVCLAAERGAVTRYMARVFDADLRERFTLRLAGAPSRTRVAPDGTLAAVTVFVTGHGYDAVDASTQTLLVDLATGGVIADLESFAVTRDGAAVHAADFNFWGVTFTPDGRAFYATLATAGRRDLVRGDVAARAASVIAADVECPSLSPDGRRLAFKRRSSTPGRPVAWRLWVMELAADAARPLAEERSVDDQVEWLDDRRVLYALPRPESAAVSDVWVAAVDGDATPRVFLREAASPAVVRGAPGGS